VTAATDHATVASERRHGLLLGPLGLAWRPRILAVTIAAIVLALVLLVVSIAVGSAGIGVGDVVRTLLGGGDSLDNLIVLQLRLPRVLTGALVGIALGVAGALTQTFTRNPLATPDVIGVSSGASLGAVAVILLGGGGAAVGSALLAIGVPGAATLGALVAAVIVYGLGWRGGVQSYRLILVGIGVAAVLDAGTSYLLVRAQITQAATAAEWLVGSLSGASWSGVWPLLVVVAVGVPLALGGSAALAVSHLGDDVARGLGQRVQLHRAWVILLAVVLTAAAVAASGPVGFVAFVVPQLGLRLTGASRPPLLLAGMLGAALVMGADLLARSVFPFEVPVGILTTIVGAPALIWQLIRHRREATS
jgi:iron complex transport system permease protein